MATDEVLYTRVREGDRAALAELIGRYHAPLLRFLYRMTNDLPTAEDLVQDTFVKLMTHEGNMPCNFKSWVFTVARNRVYDLFRTASHRREVTLTVGSEAWVPASGPGVERLVARHADREAIAGVLQALRPQHREVLVLRFYHDLKLQEIAEIIDAPLGTVKSRLHHALKQAKFHLERQEVLAHERGR
ncbi:MAG: RNA polymerase sigma factor [Anaerolineales bacterium]